MKKMTQRTKSDNNGELGKSIVGEIEVVQKWSADSE